MRIELEFSHTMFITTGAHLETRRGNDAQTARTVQPGALPDTSAGSCAPGRAKSERSWKACSPRRRQYRWYSGQRSCTVDCGRCDPSSQKLDSISLHLQTFTRRRSLRGGRQLRADRRLSGGRCLIVCLTPRIRPLPRCGQRARFRCGRLFISPALMLDPFKQLDQSERIIDRLRDIPGLPSRNTWLRDTDRTAYLRLRKPEPPETQNGFLNGCHALIIRFRITRSIRTRLMRVCIVEA